MLPTEFKKSSGVWNFTNRLVELAKPPMKPFFQLRRRDMRRVLGVEVLKRKAKFRSKLVEGERGHTRLFKYIIRCLPDRRQVVNESARPVKDDIAQHELTLRKAEPSATACFWIEKPDGAIDERDENFFGRRFRDRQLMEKSMRFLIPRLKL